MGAVRQRGCGEAGGGCGGAGGDSVLNKKPESQTDALSDASRPQTPPSEYSVSASGTPGSPPLETASWLGASGIAASDTPPLSTDSWLCASGIAASRTRPASAASQLQGLIISARAASSSSCNVENSSSVPYTDHGLCSKRSVFWTATSIFSFCPALNRAVLSHHGLSRHGAPCLLLLANCFRSRKWLARRVGEGMAG